MSKLIQELSQVYYDLELAKKITESGSEYIHKMINLLEKHETIQTRIKQIEYRKHIIETLWQIDGTQWV